MRELRKKMFSYETLDDPCKRCIDHLSVVDPGYSQPTDMANYNRETGEMNVQPTQVYVFTGNKCDLACQMCDSTFSDTHAKMYPDRIIDVQVITEDSPLHIVGRYDPQQYVLYGGEPFLSRDMYNIVRLVLTKYAGISILSNGNRPLEKNKVFTELIIPNRKRFGITFSIDGTPELNEKIRVGVNTRTILDNIRYCKEVGVFCDTHFTASKLNVHNYPEYIEWLFSEGLFRNPNFSSNLACVDYPDDHRSEVLPLEEKLAIRDKVLAFGEQVEEIAKKYDTVLNKHQLGLIKSGITGIVNSLFMDKAE